jgi:hypothetical protein
MTVYYKIPVNKRANFFLFVLQKLKLNKEAFCQRNGWSRAAIFNWISQGMPERVWLALEKEIVLYNMHKFYSRDITEKDAVIFWDELKEEFESGKKE